MSAQVPFFTETLGGDSDFLLHVSVFADRIYASAFEQRSFHGLDENLIPGQPRIRKECRGGLRLGRTHMLFA